MTKYAYLPRLTLIKAIRNGGFSILLKIEFSIPKLLYCNNFDEVEESDFGEICWKLQEVLLYTINKIEEDYPKILTTPTKTNEELFTQLMIDNPKLKYKNLLAVVGAKVLLQEQGTRGFRKIMDKFGKINWYRFNKEMKNLVISQPINPFEMLLKSLVLFESVQLEKYKNRM